MDQSNRRMKPASVRFRTYDGSEAAVCPPNAVVVLPCVRQRTDARPVMVFALCSAVARGRFDAVCGDRQGATDFNAGERSPLTTSEEKTMSLGTILLIVLILMLIGAIPTWPHSKDWGYYPSGGIGLVVIVLLILLLLGRI